MATEHRQSGHRQEHAHAQASRGSHSMWKGAISFGLVHIPVTLHAATRDSGIDFDWLDKRTMDRVGYKRVNKETGKEVDRDDIVRGVKVESGHYVVLGEDEIASAYPKSTRSIEIEGFVSAAEIPFVYLERPLYVEPTGDSAKVYALLREALARSQRVAVARVVIQTKQHLAAIIPDGPALILNLLRWSEEIRSWGELSLPPEDAKAAGLHEREIGMALQLVADMGMHWNADDYRDTFSEQVMELVRRKEAAGRITRVEEPEEAVQGRTSADVVDLTALLKRSLKGKGAADAKADEKARREEPRPHRGVRQKKQA